MRSIVAGTVGRAYGSPAAADFATPRLQTPSGRAEHLTATRRRLAAARLFSYSAGMTSGLSFGPFRLDHDGNLMRDGTAVPLGGRALALLRALAEARGRIVPKNELIARGWPGLTVEESNLAVQIAALRRVLGEDMVVTVPRRGYRLKDTGNHSGWDLPRVALVPFRTLGPEDERWFSEGIAEDIIVALSHSKVFVVLSRQAAEAGGTADYLIRGTLRRAGGRLRLAARLERSDGTQLWARTFDGVAEDIFDMQDRIAEAVAGAVAPGIEAAEIARARAERPGSVTAYDLFLRGLAEIYAETDLANRRAVDLMEQAVALEPGNGIFRAHASWVYEYRTTMGWSPVGPDDRARCLAHAHAAIATQTADARALAHCALAILQTGRDYDLGLALVRRALAVAPNSVRVLTVAAAALRHCGDLVEAEALAQRALALGDSDPIRHIALCLRADLSLIQGDISAAAMLAVEARTINPHFPPTLWVLVAALALDGRKVDATEVLEQLRRLNPDVCIAAIRAGLPEKFPDRLTNLITGLRQAGLKD